MPYLSEKNHRRLLKEAALGRLAKEGFEDKVIKIVPLIAGGIRNFHIEKAEGVTDEQHNHYVETIGLISATLEAMPVKQD